MLEEFFKQHFKEEHYTICMQQTCCQGHVTPFKRCCQLRAVCKPRCRFQASMSDQNRLVGTGLCVWLQKGPLCNQILDIQLC